ncbi:hypothetical protein GCK32_022325, partial [Trichostrongylus colubriformis]
GVGLIHINMEDEWAPLLNKDCMLFSPNGFSLEDDFHLTSLDYNPSDKVIKKEPIDETSGTAFDNNQNCGSFRNKKNHAQAPFT